MARRKAVAVAVLPLSYGAVGARQPAVRAALPLPVPAASLAAAVGLHASDPSTLLLHIIRLVNESPDGQGAGGGKRLAALRQVLAADSKATDAVASATRAAGRCSVPLLGRTIGTAEEDRQRFVRYAAAYAAAGGPQQALVEQWKKTIDRPNIAPSRRTTCPLTPTVIARLGLTVSGSGWSNGTVLRNRAHRSAGSQGRSNRVIWRRGQT